MGLLTSLWDDEILERGETRRDGDELFRVKVVGSTPAGPTIHLSGGNVAFFCFLAELEGDGRLVDIDYSCHYVCRSV